MNFRMLVDLVKVTGKRPSGVLFSRKVTFLVPVC